MPYLGPRLELQGLPVRKGWSPKGNSSCGHHKEGFGEMLAQRHAPGTLSQRPSLGALSPFVDTRGASGQGLHHPPLNGRLVLCSPDICWRRSRNITPATGLPIPVHPAPCCRPAGSENSIRASRLVPLHACQALASGAWFSGISPTRSSSAGKGGLQDGGQCVPVSSIKRSGVCHLEVLRGLKDSQRQDSAPRRVGAR